jgi:endoglucanase
MLRAVWMDDRATFDNTFQWTKDNMQHDNDKLFSWLFGKRADGTYGILDDQGGNNAATDADVDIAVALLFASERWGDPKYLYDAVDIIDDIWDKEVALVNNKPVLTANDLAGNASPTVLVNPSYFAPYAYRLFAQVDSKHDWEGVVASSYEILKQSSRSSLDKQSTSGLVPDWLEINKATGVIQAPASASLTTNYSYDAMRTPWRIALDWKWHGEPQAKEFLQQLNFLEKEWDANGKLYSTYAHDGAVIGRNESAAMYGSSIGYFIVNSPEKAKKIYEEKLISLYSPGKQSWVEPLSYYDDNWAWFGLALYYDALPNLAKDIKVR